MRFDYKAYEKLFPRQAQVVEDIIPKEDKMVDDVKDDVIEQEQATHEDIEETSDEEEK